MAASANRGSVNSASPPVSVFNDRAANIFRSVVWITIRITGIPTMAATKSRLPTVETGGQMFDLPTGLTQIRPNEALRTGIFSHFGRFSQSDFDRDTSASGLPDCPRPSTRNVTRGCANYSKPGARRPASRKRPLPSDSESRRPTSPNTSLGTAGLTCWNFWTLPPRSALILAPSSGRCCGDELARSPHAAPRFNATTSAAFAPARPAAIRSPTWSLSVRTGSSARFT